ncbi:LytTR family DNA-binding domain-containing protein [Mucilaginibacter gynuensis]|uniref:LytTR family DNA-binding domain-containing protein n=1 Tax=Mucilaginibacter gynuensis TaxID=1302236 RepID=A0ABP8GLR2_9SPHI
MSLSCYVIDDEHHAINVLSDYILNTPGLKLAGSSTNPVFALEEISTISPTDILFLDVDMPQMSGLTLAGMIPQRIEIVITTAFREYALEAFEKRAADYLLKPIRYDRFLACVQNIRMRKNAPEVQNTSPEYLFVKSGIKGKLVRINIPEILYIQAASNYIEIFTTGQKLITYLSMAEVLERLPGAEFSRIHHSYIVHHRSIRVIEPGQVWIDDKVRIPVGRAYRQHFKDKMAGHILPESK